MTFYQEILSGLPEPLGRSTTGDTTNFALFSSHADKVYIELFWDKKREKLPLNRTGDIWHIALKNLPTACDYSFLCEGPKEFLYNSEARLADPYLKNEPKPFDWQEVKSPQIPLSELIIYEMHIRGFTKHPSSGAAQAGTYLGAIEKIPHLKKLGINAVEIMPLFDFDHTHRVQQPADCHLFGARLNNYWGYNPAHFFIPNRWYAAADPFSEFKTLVRELHKNGIEVILDVVYNHTVEGKELNYYVNFRGIDNPIYYMLDKEGKYRNYSGCFNTLNANHPVAKQLILDSLRYWASEMHVDGFRFDLASILTRGTDGEPMEHPPLIEEIMKDPIIGKTKLIAEAWDAAGLYQLGTFAARGSWSEWNGQYRDAVRQFIKGTDGQAGPFAEALSGSETLYKKSNSPLSSINFITAHDGYTLRDLVSYQEKHNFDNGENNLDGSDLNFSWNCGVEGNTEDPKINELRERQMRNFLLALFVSQGIPMLLMGDEYGHTRQGNNNPYVQDNELNWFLWDELKKNERIFNFIASLTAFRKEHAQLRRDRFLTDSDVDWHNNWDPSSRFVSFTLKDSKQIFLAFNAHFEPRDITLPPNQKWRLLVNTEEPWVFHFDAPAISSAKLLPYSAMLATS